MKTRKIKKRNLRATSRRRRRERPSNRLPDLFQRFCRVRLWCADIDVSK